MSLIKSRKVEGPVVLLIMDGVGSFRPYKGNAVSEAYTPTLAKLWDVFPTALLHASSTYVGLPEKVKGNSEVGHMNIAAGKIVLQDLPRINKSILKKDFFHNKVLKEVVEYVYKSKSAIHIMGCFSDGQVHSDINHLFAILLFFKLYQVTAPIYIHAFTDGRDASPRSALKYFIELGNVISKYKLNNVMVSTIIGRRFAMDRNQQWNYTKITYDLLTQHKGIKVKNWSHALELAYKKVESDEFLPPMVIDDPRNRPIKKGDVVISYNYRADRMIQLTDAFVLESFDKFERVLAPGDVMYVTISYYGHKYAGKVRHIFPKIMVGDNIGKIISDHGLKQLRVAESVKFPHVTYFFNGGMNVVYPNEDRILHPTDATLSFDKNPKMQVYKITKTVEEKLDQGIYDFIVVNFANGDMVGHTGNLEAAKEAMQHVDECVKRIARKVLLKNGVLLVTADHGNVEEVIDPTTGQVDTEHSMYPVPFILVSKDYKKRPTKLGKLADVGVTVLTLLGIEIPASYDAEVLL